MADLIEKELQTFPKPDEVAFILDFFSLKANLKCAVLVHSSLLL